MTSWMWCILLSLAIETLTLNISFFVLSKEKNEYIPNPRFQAWLYLLFLVLNGYASSVGLSSNFNSLGYICIDNSQQANDSAYCMKSDYGSSNL